MKRIYEPVPAITTISSIDSHQTQLTVIWRMKDTNSIDVTRSVMATTDDTHGIAMLRPPSKNNSCIDLRQTVSYENASTLSNRHDISLYESVYDKFDRTILNFHKHPFKYNG